MYGDDHLKQTELTDIRNYNSYFLKKKCVKIVHKQELGKVHRYLLKSLLFHCDQSGF